MGTNCAPLVADLYLFCYERDFMTSLSDVKQAEENNADKQSSRGLETRFWLLPIYVLFAFWRAYWQTGKTHVCLKKINAYIYTKGLYDKPSPSICDGILSLYNNSRFMVFGTFPTHTAKGFLCFFSDFGMLKRSEPEFYGDLVYKFKKIVHRADLSDQFRKIIVRYKRIGYNINIMRQSACLVFNPITVNNFASLFNCTPVGRTSDSMVAPT